MERLGVFKGGSCDSDGFPFIRDNEDDGLVEFFLCGAIYLGGVIDQVEILKTSNQCPHKGSNRKKDKNPVANNLRIP